MKWMEEYSIALKTDLNQDPEKKGHTDSNKNAEHVDNINFTVYGKQNKNFFYEAVCSCSYPCHC